MTTVKGYLIDKILLQMLHQHKRTTSNLQYVVTATGSTAARVLSQDDIGRRSSETGGLRRDYHKGV